MTIAPPRAAGTSGTTKKGQRPAYWFAFLHAPVDPMFTLAVGTLYAADEAALTAPRAGGGDRFHVGLDLIR